MDTENDLSYTIVHDKDSKTLLFSVADGSKNILFYKADSAFFLCIDDLFYSPSTLGLYERITCAIQLSDSRKLLDLIERILSNVESYAINF